MSLNDLSLRTFESSDNLEVRTAIEGCNLEVDTLHNSMFRPSRLFLFLGLGLILLSLASLLIKVEINVQSPDFPDYEDFNIGFFFAPVLASYGLASLALGVAETSVTNRRKLSYLLSVFIIYMFTAVTVWLATRYGFDNPFWWVYACVQSLPSIIVTAAGVIPLVKKEQLNRVSQHYMVKIAVFITLIAVPTIYVATLWLLFLSQ